MISLLLPLLLLLQGHVARAGTPNPVSISLDTTSQIFIIGGTNTTNQQRVTISTGGDVSAIFNGTGEGMPMTNQLNNNSDVYVVDSANPGPANFSFFFEFNSGSGWYPAIVQQPEFSVPSSGLSQYTISSQDNSTRVSNDTLLIISIVSVTAPSLNSTNGTETKSAYVSRIGGHNMDDTTAANYDLYLHAKTYFNVVSGGDEIYTEVDTTDEHDNKYPATARSSFWQNTFAEAYEDRSGIILNYLIVVVVLWDPRLSELDGTYLTLAGYCSFFFSPPTGSKSMTWYAVSRGRDDVYVTSVTN